MSVQNKSLPSPDKLSRRKALRMLGLAAAVGYSVPAALMVSSSAANAEDRTIRIHRSRRDRTRRVRTERSFFIRRRRSGRFDND
jgi:hypothetical protein